MPPAPQIATATGQTLPCFVPVAVPAPVQGTNPQLSPTPQRSLDLHQRGPTGEQWRQTHAKGVASSALLTRDTASTLPCVQYTHQTAVVGGKNVVEIL